MADPASQTLETDAFSPSVDGRFEIRFDLEFADLGQGPARCYAAKPIDFPGEPQLLAWVTPVFPGPKLGHLRLQEMADSSGFGTLAHGPVGRGRRQDYACVHTAADRVPASVFGRLTARQLKRDFLAPALRALRELRNRRLSHGHIHPGNIFVEPGQKLRIVLGPSGHLPDGFVSDGCFEPIERAMADPVGRGPASSADDMFALGMTLYALASGDVPVQTVELLRRRIAFGSAQAMIAPRNIPTGIHAIIEGLIDDDPGRRWTAEMLGEALADRSPTATGGRPALGERALPPFVVGALTVKSREELLWAAMADTEMGAKVFRDGSALTWLAKAAVISPGDQSDSSALPKIESADDDKTVADAVAALAPRFPLPLAGVRFHAAAFGLLLRAALSRSPERPPVSIERLREFVASSTPDLWLASTERTARTDAQPLRALRRLRRQIADEVAFALYRLDADAPCLAAGAAGRWLTDVAAIAGLVEESCAEGAGTADPHLIGFLAAKTDLDEGLLSDPIRASARFDGACVYLDACAEIQYAAGRGRETRPAMPNLARSLSTCVDTIVSAFRDPVLRAELAQTAEGLRQAGNLVALADLLLDPALHSADEHAFLVAKEDFDRECGLMRKSAAYTASVREALEARGESAMLALGGLCAAAFVLGSFYALTIGWTFGPAVAP